MITETNPFRLWGVEDMVSFDQDKQNIGQVIQPKALLFILL